jgi:hypothetical protein
MSPSYFLFAIFATFHFPHRPTLLQKDKEAIDSDGEEAITSPGMTVANGKKKNDVHSHASLVSTPLAFSLKSL